MKIKVNEVFGPTVQGEGKSVGLQVFFLRLATCNLHCVWCDTPYTWNWVGTKYQHNDDKKYDPAKEVHEVETEKLYDMLTLLAETHGVKALVLSGGEPLIQQKLLVTLFKMLHEDGWWIEVETNGTVPPSPELDLYVSQYNVSPKLSNSGDELRLRIREKALTSLSQNPKATFKFVVASEEDMPEIIELVTAYNLTNVYVMPLGKTNEELAHTRAKAEALAEAYSLNFTDRLHVTLFGGVRGV